MHSIECPAFLSSSCAINFIYTAGSVHHDDNHPADGDCLLERFVDTPATCLGQISRQDRSVRVYRRLLRDSARLLPLRH